MPGRSSKVALVAGFLVLLALVIGLAQLANDDPPAVQPPPREAARAPEAPLQATPVERPTLIAPSAAQSAARERAPGPVAARAPSATNTKQPALVLALPNFHRDLKRDANGKLVPVISVFELRERMAVTDGPMKDCLAKSGQGATGKATLNFTIGEKGKKVVMETTGVQDEDTLAGFPELLDCMHRTASLLLPENRVAPELGTGIYVRRRVKVENGVLVEDVLHDFSYNP